MSMTTTQAVIWQARDHLAGVMANMGWFDEWPTFVHYKTWRMLCIVLGDTDDRLESADFSICPGPDGLSWRKFHADGGMIRLTDSAGGLPHCQSEAIKSTRVDA